METTKELNAANEACRVTYEAYQVAVKAYRALEIGDAEYLVARKAYYAALAAWDVAAEKVPVEPAKTAPGVGL